MTDPLAARIARETVHDLASAERIVADARQRNLTDDQITTMHERGTLTACLDDPGQSVDAGEGGNPRGLTMTDLRAILGDDRYDEVLTKATKRALFNYPNLPISIPEHEALAAQALAAVLPDLLATAWDAAVASMRYEDGTPVQLVSVVNPYRPEPDPAMFRDADTGVWWEVSDAIRAALAEDHAQPTTEGDNHD